MSGRSPTFLLSMLVSCAAPALVSFTLPIFRPWCIAVYVVGTSISSAIVQLWLARMVFKLYVLNFQFRYFCVNLTCRTKQWIWIPIISLFILAGLTGAGVTTSLLVIDSSYAARGGLVK